MPEFRNTNARWCAALVGALRDCGVRTAIVSPGSRCTPLVAALAGTPRIETIPVLDERSAAFFALGLAKSTRAPVALVCTSGTAVANYLPALVEAKMSRTPLLVFSADRPPEMQNCHAGQTIPQIGIFSNFAVWERNCVPENAPESFADAEKTARQAVENALRECAPVHVNLQFREPLAPCIFEPNTKKKPVSQSNLENFPNPKNVPANRQKANFQPISELGALGDFAGKKILIVAGTVPSGHDDAFNLNLFAKRFGVPVLADATHPLRRFASATRHVVERYDAILKGAKKSAFFKNLEPEIVIQIGTLPESKFLREWLKTLDVPAFLFNYCGDNTDALCREKAVNTRARFSDFFPEAFFDAKMPDARSDFLDAWQAADVPFRQKADAFFCAQKKSAITPSEPEIARFICENLPEPETAVFVANGMPIRDMNAFCRHGSRFWLFHNRGANGIDGTLSTALGVAHGCMEQTILYTGDLSFLHDTNGLLIAPQFRGNLTVVLQNNGGGNIFRHLPVAKENPFFEKFWLTPQRVDFERLLAAYACDFVRAGTLAELGAALDKFRAKPGIHVIEIQTDGARSRDVRAELSRL